MKKGQEAWNAWANEMLAKRDNLIETGEWSTVLAVEEWGLHPQGDRNRLRNLECRKVRHGKTAFKP